MAEHPLACSIRSPRSDGNGCNAWRAATCRWRPRPDRPADCEPGARTAAPPTAQNRGMTVSPIPHSLAAPPDWRLCREVDHRKINKIDNQRGIAPTPIGNTRMTGTKSVIYDPLSSMMPRNTIRLAAFPRSVEIVEISDAHHPLVARRSAQPRRHSLAGRHRLIAGSKNTRRGRLVAGRHPKFHTPQRKRGARSGATDPRPGEDPDRGGQKTYLGDPGGMKPNAKPAKHVARRSLDRASEKPGSAVR
jgi:hypothetical protein